MYTYSSKHNLLLLVCWADLPRSYAVATCRGWTEIVCRKANVNKLVNIIKVVQQRRKLINVLPSHKGFADVRFLRRQPDTSLHCQATDTGLTDHMVCLSSDHVPALTGTHCTYPCTEGWPGWVDLWRVHAMLYFNEFPHSWHFVGLLYLYVTWTDSYWSTAVGSAP